MGIRTLHRRTAPAQAHADTAPPAPPPPSVPGFAPAASTARIPTDLATAIRRSTATVTASARARARATVTAPADLAAALRRGATATATGAARGPAGLATAVRQAAAGTRRRFERRDREAVRQEREAPGWGLWAELGRGYLALALTLLPRTRRLPTFTVFTAVSEWPTDAPRHPRPNRRGPEPDATP
ncbi:hypothetical protein [Streptomyces resistomycificus]|uniref:Uncharacterized protein n=1 Tax=Streptomyces resistomycificus TaxID=67356 RepID=A0A0L8L1D4_9ACTN|nr:hypothetical protein [Streptomyces resistomycificus]KOG32068.1 hypothetical protein ADK37_28575 [Streptomyces resistomycificus]KUN93860.1 hypothetical protein AQJ84_28445 [Streptomyces resistomycificus]